MRERLRTVFAALRRVDRPELTPVTWTVAIFMAAILGDGVRSRAVRSPIPGPQATLIALLVMVAFVALVVVVLTVVQAIRDR